MPTSASPTGSQRRSPGASSLPTASRAATRSKYRVTGRPVPSAHLGVSRAEGRRRLGISGDAPVLAFFGALAGARSLNEFAVETYGDSGPTVLHVSGERDYEGLRGARAQRRLPAPRVDERVRSRTRRSRHRDLARGWDRLGAGRGGHACDPRALSPRDGRPPDAERTPLRAWRRRRRRPGDRARARAAPWSTSCLPTDRGSNRCARRCCRWRGRRPQRRSRRS